MTTSDVYVVAITFCDIVSVPMSCYQTYCKCKIIPNDLSYVGVDVKDSDQ